MKKFPLHVIIVVTFFSCNKLEDKISKKWDETSKNIKVKTENIVKEKLEKQISKTVADLTGAKEVQFAKIFTKGVSPVKNNLTGKKIKVTTNTSVIIFNYSADKTALFNFLQAQPSTAEEKSDRTVKKIDGKNIIEKLKIIESFLPEDIKSTPLFKTKKPNQSLEFFRINRFPLQSTIIYDPKEASFYHIVEVKNEK